MKNPCQTCINKNQDKSKCSIDCILRKDYCKYLGIPTKTKFVSYNLTEKKIHGFKEIQKLSTKGMYEKNGLLNKAINLMKQGYSNREINRVTKMSLTTVSKLRNILREQNQVFYCPCGKEATHKGWCSYRIKKSEKRRDYLGKFVQG